MKGKKVEITLHTPIFIEVADESSGRKTEAVSKLRAQVNEANEGGLLLEILEMRNERAQKLSPPDSQMFLPFHKIDHLFVL